MTIEYLQFASHAMQFAVHVVGRFFHVFRDEIDELSRLPLLPQVVPVPRHLPDRLQLLHLRLQLRNVFARWLVDLEDAQTSLQRRFRLAQCLHLLAVALNFGESIHWFDVGRERSFHGKLVQ